MSTDIKRACRWSVVDRGLLDGPFDDSLTDIMDQRRRKKELFDQTDTKLVFFFNAILVLRIQLNIYWIA